MKRVLAFAPVFLIASLVAAQQPGPQRGKIVAVDVDKRIVKLKADGKDIEVNIVEQTKLDAKGDSLAEKLASFKAGADVQFIFREKDGKNYLVGMRPFPDAGKNDAGKKPPQLVKVDSSKLLPIDELGNKEYKDGYKGGFY